MGGHIMAGKSSEGLLRTGVIGMVIAAICCFTPVLVILLGILGLGARAGYLDYVLFPILGSFLVITGYAIIRQRKQGCDPSERR